MPLPVNNQSLGKNFLDAFGYFTKKTKNFLETDNLDFVRLTGQRFCAYIPLFNAIYLIMLEIPNAYSQFQTQGLKDRLAWGLAIRCILCISQIGIPVVIIIDILATIYRIKKWDCEIFDETNIESKNVYSNIIDETGS